VTFSDTTASRFRLTLASGRETQIACDTSSTLGARPGLLAHDCARGAIDQAVSAATRS
jgi:hypothetical protein